jgi:hypothetical protein
MRLFQRDKKKRDFPNALLPPESPVFALAVPLENGCVVWFFYSLN